MSFDAQYGTEEERSVAEQMLPQGVGLEQSVKQGKIQSACKTQSKGLAFFASHLIGTADRAFTQAVLFKADIAHKGHSDITMDGRSVSAYGYDQFKIEKHVGKVTGKTIGYLVRAIA